MTKAIETIAGALLVEMFVAVMLYGITTTQAYVYWWRYPRDRKLTRRTVIAIWLLESIHTAFCIEMMYEYVIIDFGNLARLERIVWSVGATVVTAVIIAAIVQSFFIHRIWILSHGKVLITAIPSIFLFCRVALGFATASLTWKIGNWPDYRSQTGPLYTLTCGVSFAAAVDLIIALTLIYYLQQSRTGLRRTDHLVKSLQAYVINTGSLTMLVSIAIVLTFVFLKSSLLFTGLVEIQSKLYANSFLATLNARQHIGEMHRYAATNITPLHFHTLPETTYEPDLDVELRSRVAKLNDRALQAQAQLLDSCTSSEPLNPEAS